MLFSFVKNSKNKKTGSVPVTSSQLSNCSKSCGSWFFCYGKYGNCAIHWNNLNNNLEKPSHCDWKSLINKISDLESGTLFRHNEKGDLYGRNHKINKRELMELVKANKDKRGFTYTHKPVFSGGYKVVNQKTGEVVRSVVSKKMAEDNRQLIKYANNNNFVVNLSSDNFKDADRKKELNVGPVVTILPMDAEDGTRYVTPGGRKIVTCPATIKVNEDKKINCKSCGLCAIANRKSIIGFPVHGAKKTAADKQLKEAI